VRFVGIFVATFGVAVAAFAICRAMGVDQSWRNGLLAALAIAVGITVLDIVANKGTRRMPTSR
jgi:hypothetical protein